MVVALRRVHPSRHDADGVHVSRVERYMEFVQLYAKSINHIFISQSPYKDKLCHTLFGSAYAYIESAVVPTFSVKVLSDYIADNCSAKWLYDNFGSMGNTRQQREMIRHEIIDMMKHSYMLAHHGILMINATSCRAVNSLEGSMHVLETQKLVRGLILCTPGGIEKPVILHALGEVAKVCINPGVTFFRCTTTHKVSMLAGVNPAVLSNLRFAGQSVNALLSAMRAMGSRVKSSEADLNRLNGHVQEMQIKMALVTSQMRKVTRCLSEVVEAISEGAGSNNPAIRRTKALLEKIRADHSLTSCVLATSASRFSSNLSVPVPFPQPVNIGATPSPKRFKVPVARSSSATTTPVPAMAPEAGTGVVEVGDGRGTGALLSVPVPFPQPVNIGVTPSPKRFKVPVARSSSATTTPVPAMAPEAGTRVVVVGDGRGTGALGLLGLGVAPILIGWGKGTGTDKLDEKREAEVANTQLVSE
jgi:hypothetical protein